MIDQVCAHIHNYFEINPVTGQPMIYPGHYAIENGSITLPFLKENQYFRLFGSTFNDGVHQYGVDALTDEEFDGVVWEMRPPKAFIDLVAEITEWMDKYGDTMKNPYQSEDVIGVYQYTKMTTGKVTGDYIATWENAYKTQLNEWRRIA